MKLCLDRSDLLPKYRDIVASQVCYCHFLEAVRLLITKIGSAEFRDKDVHVEIRPAERTAEFFGFTERQFGYVQALASGVTIKQIASNSGRSLDSVYKTLRAARLVVGATDLRDLVHIYKHKV